MSASQPYGVPNIVSEVLNSQGQPLDQATRAFFEPRFGHDFSRVRVHAGDRAAESAEAINAAAYTVGADVVFGSGRYAPSTFAGKQLIAHELAHTIQQSPSGHIGTRNLGITTHDDPSERQADQIADSAMSGSSWPSPVQGLSPLIQRTPLGPDIPSLDEPGDVPDPGKKAKKGKPAFPVTGKASCFCDNGDKSTSGKPMACGDDCPNEKELFVAWPHRNVACAKITKEGKNVPPVPCNGKVKIAFGGSTVTATVKDCGPKPKGRIVDLSLAVAKRLDPTVETCSDWGINDVTVSQ